MARMMPRVRLSGEVLQFLSVKLHPTAAAPGLPAIFTCRQCRPRPDSEMLLGFASVVAICLLFAVAGKSSPEQKPAHRRAHLISPSASRFAKLSLKQTSFRRSYPIHFFMFKALGGERAATKQLFEAWMLSIA